MMIDYSSLIPLDLQTVPRWCLTDGNSKIPVRCDSSHRFARCNHSEDVGGFDDAVKWYESGGYSGISFLCGGGWSFIDLDSVVSDDGSVSAVAESVLNHFDGKAFVEKSRSGRGFHILARGNFPGVVKTKEIEIYSKSHFCAVTADVYGSQSVSFPDMSESLEYLAKWIRGKQERNKPPKEQDFPQKQGLSLSVGETIEKALNARNGVRFSLLLAGDWQSLGYGSRSEGELAFCNMLAFWFSNRRDAEMVFQQSGLFKDARKMRLAMNKAYSDCRDHFSAS